MKTKEAIEFIEYLITIADERYNEDSVKKKDEVIDLLKRGEKFENICREIKIFATDGVKHNCPEGFAERYLFDKTIKCIEQKYFPKGGSQ